MMRMRKVKGSLRLIYHELQQSAVEGSLELFIRSINGSVIDRIQEPYWKDPSFALMELIIQMESHSMYKIKNALCDAFSIAPSELVLSEERDSIELAYYPSLQVAAERRKVFLVLYICK